MKITFENGEVLFLSTRSQEAQPEKAIAFRHGYVNLSPVIMFCYQPDVKWIDLMWLWGRIQIIKFSKKRKEVEPEKTDS